MGEKSIFDKMISLLFFINNTTKERFVEVILANFEIPYFNRLFLIEELNIQQGIMFKWLTRCARLKIKV